MLFIDFSAANIGLGIYYADLILNNQAEGIYFILVQHKKYTINKQLSRYKLFRQSEPLKNKSLWAVL